MSKQLEELKKELISEITNRKEEEIMESTKADLLISLIRGAKTEFEAITIAEMGTIYIRTGFHYDVIPERKTDSIKYLERNIKLSFSNGGTHHKLIIGDNYDALRQLLISYKGKVDVIYIDPPYGCNSMGEFAKTNYENQLSRDNLLSMLSIRIRIAKKLLKDEGVIFISVDDKNQAYIKCLMDSIWGERYFLATFCKKGVGSKQDSKTYSAIHEYVLCYASDTDSFVPGLDENNNANKFNKQLPNGRKYKTQLLRKWGDKDRREDRENLFYPIYYSPSSCSFSLDKDSQKDNIEFYPRLSDGDGRWRWDKEKMKKGFDEERVEIAKDECGIDTPYERLFLDEAKLKKPFTTWLDKIKNDGKKELKSIMGEDLFDYPKPVDLCKQLLMMIDNKDAVVLDFFAGSGTMGQAVLAQNKADGGKRQFICCTSNEKTDKTPNGIVYDCTAKRLKRIMTGSCYDKSTSFNWLKNNKPYGDSLDVYEIKIVSDKVVSEGKTPFDVIDETNYDLNEFSTKEERIKWVCANFEQTEYSVEE